MQTQEMDKRVPAETIIGLFAVGWSLIGVMGVVHATTHSGINSLIGWVSVVAANVLVYSTSRYSERRERFVKSRAYFVGMIVWLVIMTVMITDMAGVWDAR